MVIYNYSRAAADEMSIFTANIQTNDQILMGVAIYLIGCEDKPISSCRTFSFLNLF
jgi:hypothetical protein